MPNVYRFRTIRQILRDYEELRRQTIYFAPQDELNDGLEGFREVYWAGDEITWPNLFEHYLFCLERFYRAYKYLPSDLELNSAHIPVYMHKGHVIAQQERDIITEIERRVREQTILFNVVPNAFQGNRRVRRGELWGYLQALHDIALKIIDDVYIDFQLVPESERKSYETRDLIQELKDLGYFNLLNETKDPNVPEEFYAVFRNIIQRRSLGYVMRSKGVHYEEHDENLRFMLFDFPGSYIDGIEKMIQPAWYVACFAKDFRNSVMWGHYGGGHTGVCLEFESEANNAETGLTLLQPDPDSLQEDEYRSHFLSFRDVDYGDYPGPCDFFKCVSSVADPGIWRWWLMNENGGKSSVIDQFDANDTVDQLVQFRLDQMFADVSFKTSDWSYEEEKRLILYQSDIDLTDKARRVLKYDFNSLKSVIFGMKTNENDRLRTMEIIKDKCQANGRTDFEFYDAYYSPITRKIEKVRIPTG